MNKLPKDKRDKIIGVTMGTLMVVIALWFVLINPLRSKLAQTGRLTADSRAQVERGLKTLASTQQVATAFADVSAQLKSAEDAMAAGDLYAWMIQTMNQFKLAHSVDIPQISREIPCEVGVFPQFPYRAATFVMHGAAYYHDFGKFLADFENRFPFIRVQNLELEPAVSMKKDEESERLQFKMELVTLIKPVAP